MNSRVASVTSLKAHPMTNETIIKESKLLLLIGLYRSLVLESQ